MRLLTICLLLLCSPGKAAEIGLWELPNYYEYSAKLASSGQPTREQFSSIADAGVQHIINLAPKSSPDAILNERRMAEALGIGYSHIPVNWDNPAITDLEEFMSVAAANEDKVILVHCWLNLRASAFVYLSRILGGDFDEEKEFAVLQEIWSTHPGYEIENVPHWRRFLSRALSEYR